MPDGFDVRLGDSADALDATAAQYLTVTRSVVDQIPERWRELFVSALAKRIPSGDDAQSAQRALMSEFTEHVNADSEPTPTGRELDDLVGYFIDNFTMT